MTFMSVKIKLKDGEVIDISGSGDVQTYAGRYVFRVNSEVWSINIDDVSYIKYSQ